MLAFREWKVVLKDREPVLHSLIWSDRWPDTIAVADKTPKPENNRGLYAYAPWSDQALLPISFAGDPVLVVGAVDASGTVAVHEDGVIRAERMRIFALRLVPPRPNHHLTVWFDGTVAYCACLGCSGTPSAEELEEMLLRRYGVPRLPDNTGPWPAPFGTGPVSMEV